VSDKLKILFLTYQGDLGGATQSMIYLSEGLAARGHEVWFGCRPESMVYGALKGGEVRLASMEFTRFGGPASGEITRLCSERGIQIVNAQSSQDRYAVMRARLSGGLKAKVVFTRRQMPSSSWLSCKLNGLFAHRVIAVSAGVADALCKCGVPRSKLEVVYNGTPPEKYDKLFESDTEAWRRELGIEPGTVVIGCIARKKRQDLLIEATRWLPPEAVILIAGPGEQPEWTEKIEALKPRQRIIILPYTDRSLALYPLLSVSVLPSMIEGLSQTVLESMAMGVPVAASRWGGNPEIVEHGVSGLLFDPNDARDLAAQVNCLLEDSKLAASCVERGRGVALEEFNIERTISRTERCFRNLLGEG
jgi:L-malate glycosyltransferase